MPERRLQQACGNPRALCANRCVPLPTVPVLAVADVARQICDPGGDWARAHASCLNASAAREPASARAAGAARADAGSRFTAATRRLVSPSSAERYWLRQRGDSAWPLFTTTAFGGRRAISANEKRANVPTISTLCRGQRGQRPYGAKPPPARAGGQK
jgi:hypothetical protein